MKNDLNEINKLSWKDVSLFEMKNSEKELLRPDQPRNLSFVEMFKNRVIE